MSEIISALVALPTLSFYDEALRNSRRRCLATARLLSNTNLELEYSPNSFEEVFGSLERDSALATEGWDWGFPFHEPQITRGICEILSDFERDVDLIADLLARMGLKRSLLTGVKRYEFLAEHQRMDILIRGYNEQETRCLSVVIEAKINHHLTLGQLSRYNSKIKHETNIHRFILAKSSNSMNSLKGMQRIMWKFISWKRLIHLLLQSELASRSPRAKSFLSVLFHQLEHA